MGSCGWNCSLTSAMRNLTQSTVIRRVHRSEPVIIWRTQTQFCTRQDFLLIRLPESPQSIKTGFSQLSQGNQGGAHQVLYELAHLYIHRLSLLPCSFCCPPPTHSATTLEGTRSRECVHTTRKGRSNHHRAKG